MLTNFNLVSGLFNLYKDSYPGRLEYIIHNAQPLFKLSIPLVMFCDDDTYPLIPNFPHIIKHKINLYEYEIFYRGLQVKLPTTRCLKKDTAEFIAFGNMKMELMEIAKRYFAFNDFLVWIDAGVSKVVSEYALRTLRHKWFKNINGIRAPGIEPRQPLDFNKPMWRFCGGTFVMNRECDTQIFKKYLLMMYDCGYTTWEGNLWALIESIKPDEIEWVQGHFNDSLISSL